MTALTLQPKRVWSGVGVGGWPSFSLGTDSCPRVAAEWGSWSRDA